MNNLSNLIKNYLNYCKLQKQLDSKTLKAYRIDLTQFSDAIAAKNIHEITSSMPEDFISNFTKNTSLKLLSESSLSFEHSSTILNTKKSLNAIHFTK